MSISTATLDAATWGAELAVGEGRGRIFIVEPTGPIEDDPNLTDKKFPGNPTRSYRTAEPCASSMSCLDWPGHSPEQLAAMQASLACPRCPGHRSDRRLGRARPRVPAPRRRRYRAEPLLRPAEAVGGEDEFVEGAGLGGGVAGVGDDAQLSLGPGAVQLPGGFDGADDVVAALDDDSRQVTDAANVGEQLIGVRRKPSFMK